MDRTKFFATRKISVNSSGSLSEGYSSEKSQPQEEDLSPEITQLEHVSIVHPHVYTTTPPVHLSRPPHLTIPNPKKTSSYKTPSFAPTKRS